MRDTPPEATANTAGEGRGAEAGKASAEGARQSTQHSQDGSNRDTGEQGRRGGHTAPESSSRGGGLWLDRGTVAEQSGPEDDLKGQGTRARGRRPKGWCPRSCRATRPPQQGHPFQKIRLGCRPLRERGQWERSQRNHQRGCPTQGQSPGHPRPQPLSRAPPPREARDCGPPTSSLSRTGILRKIQPGGERPPDGEFFLPPTSPRPRLPFPPRLPS